MAPTKKEHYVPQFYLTYFTTNGERLFVYDKFARKAFPAGKTDIGHENYFYDIPSQMINSARRAEGIDEKFIEKGLAELEGKFFSPALKEINAAPEDQPIHSEVIQAMAVFLTIQILRTKDMREQIIEGERAFKQSVADTLVELNFPEVKKGNVRIEYKKDFEAFVQAQYIFDTENLEEMSKELCKMIWVVAVNKTSTPFYTSDNPVVKDNHIKEVGKRGWLSPGVEINFPLSPTRLLLIYERSHFNAYEAADSRFVEMTDPEEVAEFNRYQVIGSHRQIYSVNDDFVLADKMCEANPELCRPRKKIQVDTSDIIATADPNRRTQLIHIHEPDFEPKE